MDIRTILCPTDFSDASRHALDHAAAIAQWYSARILMLHVDVPIGATVRALVSAAGGAADDTTETVPGERRKLAMALETMQMNAHRSVRDVEIDTKVMSGPAADTVVACATEAAADLIVIGTRGADGLEHLVLGSVTEKVLRKAACPVLTVPPRSQATSSLPFKRILCPIDFSSASLAGLQLAFSFAQEADATLTLLHAIDEPDDNALFVARPCDRHGHRAAHEQQVLDYLQTLVPKSVREWSSPQLRVVSGKAHDQILALAADERADLIVIGVERRKALDLMLLGSTTNQVLRRATCPVLTVASRA